MQGDARAYREKPIFSVGKMVDTLGLVRRDLTARERGAAARTGLSRSLDKIHNKMLYQSVKDMKDTLAVFHLFVLYDCPNQFP